MGLVRGFLMRGRRLTGFKGASHLACALGLATWGSGPAYGQTNIKTYKRTDIRKISPFYRTLFPIGAAALPPPMKTKEKVEQGKGTADHLMPLGYLFRCAISCNGFSFVGLFPIPFAEFRSYSVSLVIYFSSSSC